MENGSGGEKDGIGRRPGAGLSLMESMGLAYKSGSFPDRMVQNCQQTMGGPAGEHE